MYLRTIIKQTGHSEHAPLCYCWLALTNGTLKHKTHDMWNATFFYFIWGWGWDFNLLVVIITSWESKIWPSNRISPQVLPGRMLLHSLYFLPICQLLRFSWGSLSEVSQFFFLRNTVTLSATHFISLTAHIKFCKNCLYWSALGLDTKFPFHQTIVKWGINIWKTEASQIIILISSKQFKGRKAHSKK